MDLGQVLPTVHLELLLLVLKVLIEVSGGLVAIEVPHVLWVVLAGVAVRGIFHGGVPGSKAPLWDPLKQIVKVVWIHGTLFPSLSFWLDLKTLRVLVTGSGSNIGDVIDGSGWGTLLHK